MRIPSLAACIGVLSIVVPARAQFDRPTGSSSLPPTAVTAPDGREATVEGLVEGVLLEAPRGVGGFGYDPLFYYPPLGATFAEITPEAKHAVSHRGRAMALARELLRRWS